VRISSLTTRSRLAARPAGCQNILAEERRDKINGVRPH
jgi:hypothetical protein